MSGFVTGSEGQSDKHPVSLIGGYHRPRRQSVASDAAPIAMPRNYSEQTIKILFGQASGRCAFPNCESPIIAPRTSTDPPAVLAQIAHIVASSDSGPRGDRLFPRADLDREPNLLVLCAHHHVQVDAQGSTYTADDLRRWKRTLVGITPNAETLIEEAGVKLRDHRWEEAVVLLEQAAQLPVEPHADTRRRAFETAARCLIASQFGRAHADAAVLRRIDGHLDSAAAAGARVSTTLTSRAWVSGLRDEPELMLRHATEALVAADATVESRGDAIHAQLDALTRLGRHQDAASLCEGAARTVLDELEGEYWLQLGVSRLIVLAKMQSAQLTSEVHEFAHEARCRAGSEKPDRLAPFQLAVRLSEIATQFGWDGRLPEALEMSLAACDVAALQPDPELTMSVVLQAANLSASCNDEDRVRQCLSIHEVQQAVAVTETDPSLGPWSRLLGAFTRGQCLGTLARHAGRKPQPAHALLVEAQESLRQAAATGDKYRDQLQRRNGFELLLADIAYWRGRAASDLGRNNEAVEHFRAARSDSAKADPRFWAHRGLPAWVNEAKSLRLDGRLAEAHITIRDAVNAAESARDQNPLDKTTAEYGVHARTFLDHIERVELPVFEWLESDAAHDIGLESIQSTLHGSIATQVAPLVSWWQEWTEIDGGEPFAELLDFWGRGGLCQVAAAIRPQAHRAVAVDASSIDEIRRWARILCPLFDTVIVKWKGSLVDNRIVMCPLRVDYGGLGGHGYTMLTGEELINPNWCQSAGAASLVAPDLAAFLCREALPLIRDGRLVLVPAPLVGCTQSATGWTDDLFVNGLLGGAVSVVGADNATPRGHRARQRILDLSATVVPYIENVPMADLARVLEEASDWLRPLRAVVLEAIGSEDLRHERWDRITILEDDIRDACRELEDRYQRVVRAERNPTWHVEQINSRVGATERAHEVHDLYAVSDPITDVLRGVAGASYDPGPWIPYWLLTGTGGHLDWTCPLDNRVRRPNVVEEERSEEGRPLSSWLHPGSPAGWFRPAVISRK